MDTISLEKQLEISPLAKEIAVSQQQIMQSENLKEYEKLLMQFKLESITTNLNDILRDDISKRNPAIAICKYLNPEAEFPYDVSENKQTPGESANCISNIIYFNLSEISLDYFPAILKENPELVISRSRLLSKAFPFSFRDLVRRSPDLLLNSNDELEEKINHLTKLSNVTTYKAENLIKLLSVDSQTLHTLIISTPTYSYITQSEIEKVLNSPIGLETEVFLNEMQLKFVTEPTGKYLLDKDQEEMLFKALSKKNDDFENEEQMKSYTKKIKQVIVRCNDGLIHNSMKKFHLSGDEHFSDGQVGLLNAIRKFDYTKGFKFSTYATQWIDQSLTRQIHQGDYDDIAKPNNLGAKLLKYKRISAELYMALKREPTTDEVLDYCKKKGIKMVTSFSLNPILKAEHSVSLDADQLENDDSDSDSDTSLHNILTNDDIIRKNVDERLVKIETIMKQLTPRDLDILTRYANGETMREIGIQYTITPERIRQLLQRIAYQIKSYDLD
ncbi:sigma-70 family RNA polymerase sigma factor [Patescibacteria group bacterium]|nr:sigma-70 family RNA polymerase sigma factor [Patescibacteria group bacterium]